MQSKILVYPSLEAIKFLSRAPNKVLIGGCFDLFHFGHLKFIQASKDCGNFLVVALESNEAIMRYKGAMPIHTQRQRAEILASLTDVDCVLLIPMLSGFDDYMELVKTVHPTSLAITNGDVQINNKEKQASLVGAKLVVVNQLVEGLSSSIIRSKLLD